MTNIRIGYDGGAVDVYAMRDGLPREGLFGEMAVARRLLRRDPITASAGAAPTQRHVLVIGDSRITNITPDLALQSPKLPWGTAYMGLQGLPTSAWATGAYGAQPTAAVATPWGNLASLGTNNAIYATCNGTAVPGGNDIVNRTFYGAQFQPDLTAALNQFQNKAFTIYVVFLCGPFGLVGNHAYLSARLNTSLVATWKSANFTTYQAQQGWKVVSLTIPARDWSTGDYFNLEVCVDGGWTPGNGEVVVCTDGPFITTDSGISWINKAVGGRWTRNYDDNAIFDFSSFFRSGGSISSNWTLWMDLGTNGTGPGFTTTEEDIAYKQSIIAKFRQFVPDGDVILSCAHDGGTDAPCCSTWFRDANMRIAQNSYNVLSIDSSRIFPSYPEALAAGYFTPPDIVHLNANGRPVWRDAIFGALRSAAGIFYR